jgi:hypothetical protein
MKKTLPITLKWGALLGIALSLLQLAKVYSKSFDFYAFGPVLDLLNALIFIAILYIGIKEIKEECFDGIITFSKAFLKGAIMVVVAFLIVFLYLNLQYGIIFKDELPKINEANKEKFKEHLLKDSLTNEEFELVMSSQLSLLKSEKNRILFDANIDSINGILISNRLDTVFQYYTHFLNTQKDSVDLFTLGKFDEFSRVALMNVLGKYLTTLPEYDSLAPYLSSIITNGNVHFASISPITLRFEKEQHKIPIHTQSFSAALTFSLSVILYGLLFNIFVAMYLYDRKKRVIQENQTEEIES